MIDHEALLCLVDLHEPSSSKNGADAERSLGF